MKLKKSKILVTGSSGTIGNLLCEKLLEKGAEITGIDWRKNLWNKEVLKRTLDLDLRDARNLNNLDSDFDLVIHLAANARVYKLVKNPDLAKDNFLTLYNVLEFVRRSNISRFIFSSSREVYGNSGHIIHSEDESYVKNCESSYTATKIAGEALIHAYHNCYKTDFIILRFSNVYGRYDYSDRVVPLFIVKALKNMDLEIFGKEKILDFTYIDDAVEGILKSIERLEAAKNEVYNIASQKGISMAEVARIIIDETESKSKLFFKENRAGEVTRFIADINKAQAVLNYYPKYSLLEGIKKTIYWYKEKVDEYIENNQTIFKIK